MPRLRQHVWLCGLGFCVGQCRRTLAWRLGLALAAGPHAAAAHASAVCAAKPLALQHRQELDVPLDWAGTPGQGDAGGHGRLVLGEPRGKAAHGLYSPRGGAFEPGSERRRLPLPDQRGTGLREGKRLSPTQVARRGGSGGQGGSATAGTGGRGRRGPGGRPWACRKRRA
jgi:hypothetical protein